MEIDELITLDDNKQYVLLSKAEKDGKNYFLAAEIINDQPSENYEIFEEINENNEISVEVVDNQELIDELVIIFESIYDADESK